MIGIMARKGNEIRGYETRKLSVAYALIRQLWADGFDVWMAL